MRRSSLASLAFLGTLGLVLAVSQPGCGSSGEGDANYSRKFEEPPVPAKVVTDAPDTGEEQSPRDRRGAAKE